MAFFNKTSNNQAQNTTPTNTPGSNVSEVLDTVDKLDITTPVDIQVDEQGIKSIMPKPVETNINPVETHERLMSNEQKLIDDSLSELRSLKDTSVQGVESELQYADYNLDQILTSAVNAGASDIHFTVGYRASIRVDGTLKTFKSAVLTPDITLNYAKQFIKRRTDLNLEDIREADLTYAIGEKRFRVNIFKQMGFFSIACRVIPEKIATLEDLNLPTILKEFTKFPNGLVLVTGPTGSGKSTTIASILNNINLTQSKHITSIEDPVEYVFPKSVSLIDQREFGIDFTSWSKALRSVLRQDPDIVFLGEMRDLESIEAALQIADTGHLVFATLHTNGAAQSIDRIIDVFPADRQSQIRIQLASVLRAVVYQRLVALPTEGRMPVAEILIANPAVRNAVRDKKVFLIDNIIQTSSDEGMISMEKSLASLVKRGLISLNSAKSLSLRPKEIDILVKQ